MLTWTKSNTCSFISRSFIKFQSLFLPGFGVPPLSRLGLLLGFPMFELSPSSCSCPAASNTAFVTSFVCFRPTASQNTSSPFPAVKEVTVHQAPRCGQMGHREGHRKLTQHARKQRSEWVQCDAVTPALTQRPLKMARCDNSSIIKQHSVRVPEFTGSCQLESIVLGECSLVIDETLPCGKVQLVVFRCISAFCRFCGAMLFVARANANWM